MPLVKSRKPFAKISKPPGRRRKFGAVGISIAVVLVLLLGAGGYLYWAWKHPLMPGTDTYIVKPGTSLRGLASQLYERQVIAEPHTLIWLGHLTGRSRHLKAGEYRFRPRITAAELLDQVVAGRVIEYPLVLIEGWNFRQMMQAIEAAPKLTHTLSGLSQQQIMARLGHPNLHPEGRFYPDTYYFSVGHTDVNILTRAFEKMQALLQEEWENREDDLPLKNMDEALTLASIIEKETGAPEERPMVAGVFVNRLRKGMRLQTDPTVIYGMGASFDGNIRSADLRRDTPYNTYTRRGLPPTPIAMPSRASLVAALHPSKTDALYFVSRGDGTHIFSSNFAQHDAAVTKYQLRGKKARGPRSGAAKPTTAP